MKKKKEEFFYDKITKIHKIDKIDKTGIDFVY